VKRVLVLGGAGMLGHKISQILSRRFETYATFRSVPRMQGIFEEVVPVLDVEATDLVSVARCLKSVKPDVVINAIGIVKQVSLAHDPVTSISINALFPHQLARVCSDASAYLVHVSTDCVFSGQKGNYSEDESPDATDLYGRSKALGEPIAEHVLTVRTSLIGRELSRRSGLVEWFLNQEGGVVRGYSRAVFSGVTTETFADIITALITADARLHGLWHLSGPAISKLQLLQWLKEAFGRSTQVIPDDRVVYDRSLNSQRFWSATGLRRPEWAEMIQALKEDPTPYG
jgi:dTDP-4-dehydrorhamnose reductase